LLVQILNRSTGAIVASVNAEVATSSSTTRARTATTTRQPLDRLGMAAVGGACSAASPCTPVLAIIDATTHVVVRCRPATTPTRWQSIRHRAWRSADFPRRLAGCSTCAANGFNDAGVAVFATGNDGAVAR
jgi:hypothetical protein